MYALVLCLLPFLAAHGEYGTPAVVPDTLVTTGTYDVDVDYPSFFKNPMSPLLFLGGLIIGAEPDSVIYEEWWTITDSTRRWSCSVMTADGEDVWFLVNADTADASFTDFPGEERQLVVADALGVLTPFITFLTDTTQFSFSGTFSHRWAPLRIEARAENPSPPGTRYVIAEATAATGPYLTGWITVAWRGTEVSYSRIQALFHESGIVVTITRRGYAPDE